MPANTSPLPAVASQGAAASPVAALSSDDGEQAASAVPASAMPRPAATADIIAEIAASHLTERGATRADDRLSEAAMEDRKREGYF